MSTTVIDKRSRRQRTTRRSIYYCAVEFDTYIPDGGYSERLRRKEISIDNPNIKEDMDKTFNLWLKGNIEPEFLRGKKTSAAVSKKSRTVKERFNKETKKVEYDVDFHPLTKSYVLSMKYFVTDEDGYEQDEEGNPIKPWMHIVFHDGSQVDLLVKQKRR